MGAQRNISKNEFLSLTSRKINFKLISTAPKPIFFFNYNTFKKTGGSHVAARSLFCLMGRKWASLKTPGLKHRLILLKVL